MEFEISSDKEMSGDKDFTIEDDEMVSSGDEETEDTVFVNETRVRRESRKQRLLHLLPPKRKRR
jgi:hypothetical protein